MEPMYTGSPARLKDPEGNEEGWGVWVSPHNVDSDDIEDIRAALVGATVQVEAQSGKTWDKVVSAVRWADQHKALCETEGGRTASTASPKRSDGRRTAAAASAGSSEWQATVVKELRLIRIAVEKLAGIESPGAPPRRAPTGRPSPPQPAGPPPAVPSDPSGQDDDLPF